MKAVTFNYGLNMAGEGYVVSLPHRDFPEEEVGDNSHTMLIGASRVDLFFKQLALNPEKGFTVDLLIAQLIRREVEKYFEGIGIQAGTK